MRELSLLLCKIMTIRNWYYLPFPSPTPLVDTRLTVFFEKMSVCTEFWNFCKSLFSLKHSLYSLSIINWMWKQICVYILESKTKVNFAIRSCKILARFLQDGIKSYKILTRPNKINFFLQDSYKISYFLQDSKKNNFLLQDLARSIFLNTPEIPQKSR